MSNLIPINHSFQRLHGSALDDTTYVFNTKEEAQEYASTSELAYKGQLLFIKEYREAENIADDNIKSTLYYIDDEKIIKPVCWLDYSTICILLEILKQAEYKKDMSSQLNDLKNDLLGTLVDDYEMIIISRKKIPNDMFDRSGAIFKTVEELEDGSYKHTYTVDGIFYLYSTYYYQTENVFVFKKYEAIYVKIPFAKAKNLRSLFSGCKYLEEYDFPYLDTSELSDIYCLFTGCEKLTSTLNLHSWDLSNLINLDTAFYGSCFEYIDTTSWDTSSAGYMYDMFLYADAKRINLSGLDTSKVTQMHNMFSGCYNLEEVDAYSLDMSSVEFAPSMFSQCTSLKTIDISTWNPVRLQRASGMFGGCTNLEEIIGIETLPTPVVTETVGMFSDCDSLIRLDLSKWNFRPLKASSMFYGCDNLEELDLSGWRMHMCGSIREMFRYCPKLKKLNLSGWTLHPYCETDWMFDGCYSLTRENIITEGCDEYTISVIDYRF